MSVVTRCAVLLVSTVIVASCATRQPAISSELAAALDGGQARTRIVNSESCFARPFDNYDSWLELLQDSTPTKKLAQLKRRIGKDRFDRARKQLDCQRFQYLVGDITVEAYSIRPLSPSSPAELPVIIYNRGGNASYSRLELHVLFQRLFHLAEQGFFVIATQYRGSGLEGENINPGKDEFGGADVDDVMALFDLIDDSPFADKNRIGMFGWSRGAIMSFLAATRTDRLSALVVGGAPSDIVEELEVRPQMEAVFAARIPDYASDRIAALQSRSVLYWAERLPKSLPILILHGQSDKKVTVNSARRLARELQVQKIPHRLVLYENGNHSLLNHREAVNEEIAAWFAAKL